MTVNVSQDVHQKLIQRFEAYSVATRTKLGISAREISDTIFSIPLAMLHFFTSIFALTKYDNICNKMTDEKTNMVSESLDGTDICFFKI